MHTRKISPHTESCVRPLSRYRVLDLSDERGILAGYLLAQLGADVIHIEPPQGSAARQVPPFSELSDKPAQSLFWKAFAAGTRSIALALHTDQGRAALLALVATTDILIETALPQEMERIGLGREVLRRANPRLIHVNITAFGSSGPKAGYAASDLTVWASAGPLALTRDPDSGRPLSMAIPQAFHQAATDAACGALMALYARGDDGPGQHIEVSAQSSNTLCTLFGHLAASVNHENYSMANAGMKPKDLDLSGSGSRTQKTMWSVRDGTIEMHIGIGTAAGRFSNALFAWLNEIGECPPEFASWDWITVPDRIRDGELTMEDVERARAHVEPVLARFSKNDLVQIAEQKGLMLAPILTTADIAVSPQLLARDFLACVEGEEPPLVVPAPFNNCGPLLDRIQRAPQINEHGPQLLAELRIGVEGSIQ